MISEAASFEAASFEAASLEASSFEAASFEAASFEASSFGCPQKPSLTARIRWFPAGSKPDLPETIPLRTGVVWVGDGL